MNKLLFQDLNRIEFEDVLQKEQYRTKLTAIHVVDCDISGSSLSLLVLLLQRNADFLEYFKLQVSKLGYLALIRSLARLTSLSSIYFAYFADRYIPNLCTTIPNTLKVIDVRVPFYEYLLDDFIPVITKCVYLEDFTLLWHDSRRHSLYYSSFFDALTGHTSIIKLRTSAVKEIDEPFERYLWINRINKELCSNVSHNSVPNTLRTYDEIRQFLIDVNTQKWNTLKLVVLGHGEVGKTTLIHAIQRQMDWKPQILQAPIHKTVGLERTVGVDLSTLKIGKGEVSVWDFGGQLEYAVTHQLFLSVEMVVYLVCYSLAAEEQNEQLSYWLDFLHSTLSGTPDTKSKWLVLIVGTKSDKCQLKPHDNPIPSWQARWPNLPLYHKHLTVSSHKNIGIKNLLQELTLVCNTIFEKHTTQIPRTYKALLESIQAIPPDQTIISISNLKAIHWTGKKDQFSLALKYLHSIGQIVVLGGALVCTTPQLIPKITAEFISPKEIRNKLLVNHKVEILDEQQIGVILNISAGTAELNKKLHIMELVGVCFKLANQKNVEPSYLFPSLASYAAEIKFSIPCDSSFQYCGVRITAPPRQVFTSAFFCQLIVGLFSMLNISRRELIEVHSNGIVVSCQGMFLGQLLVKIERQSKSVAVLQLARNPDLGFITPVIQQLVKYNFYEYAGFEEQHLCASCIGGSITHTEDIGIVLTDNKMCSNLLHEVAPVIPPKARVHECRTHNRLQHHFFLNYRVSSEGTKGTYPSSAERDGGLVELIYEKLAPSKFNGEDIFIFWDKKCLNDGQDWLDGFLHGITHSNAIILIISEKVISGICNNAVTSQDNVLVEYECALLKNRRDGTAVLPVFVAEITQTGDFIPFDFKRAQAILPQSEHARGDKASNMIAKLSDILTPEQTGFLSSIAKTVEEIFHLQGIFMAHRGEEKDEMDDLVVRVMNAMQKFS